MKKIKSISLWLCVGLCWLNACKIPALETRIENRSLPEGYLKPSADSLDQASLNWRQYFKDEHLIALIDTALKNNQEIQIIGREIEIARNEIRSRKGEYLPSGNVGLGFGVDRSGEYTFNGMSEKDIQDKQGELPRYVGDHALMANFSWEVDIWRKLHNAKDAAVKRYLSSVDGRNFAVTELVSEIAAAYYELLVLDNELAIVERNASIQKDALDMVRVQKDAAKLNQLAVNRFEAQWMNTRNLRYDILQEMVVLENKINYLLARSPQTIQRTQVDLSGLNLLPLQSGYPTQLLSNRADVKQAEHELEAAKLDVKVARANFYPSLTLRAGVGFQSYNPLYLFDPKSLALGILGDAMAPLINRNNLKALYGNAGSRQMQAVVKYEQTLLRAYVEVVNQLNGTENFTESFKTKNRQVEVLNESIDISNSLFKSARADYTEVLLTQREALEAKMELIEIKRKQLLASINLYKALGGGWQ